MRLSARRFPDRIVRRRHGSDTVNEYGEPVPGPVRLTEHRASVQPITNEDLDLVEGNRLLERWTVYVPEPEALVAARESAPADMVTLAGRGDFVVERSILWPKYTKATLLRET